MEHAFPIWKVDLLIVLIPEKAGEMQRAHAYQTQSIQDIEASVPTRIISSVLVVVLKRPNPVLIEFSHFL